MCVCVLTNYFGVEGAAGDVLLVVFHQDVVISRQRGQVADAARPVFVVHAADLGFGRTLDGQVQTSWTDGRLFRWSSQTRPLKSAAAIL